MRQLTMHSRAPAPSTGAVANPGWLSHDGAILGRRNTMREKLITATKPTSQNYYRANPTGNELGTEPAANSVACASTWSGPQIKTSHN